MTRSVRVVLFFCIYSIGVRDTELQQMKLVQPTDFEILDALSDRKRDVAANIAMELGKNRDYINTRLPVLADYQLVSKVGPAQNSGIYEITDRGLTMLDLRDEYDEIDDLSSKLDN